MPANALANDAGERLPTLPERAVFRPNVDGFLSNACALQVGMHRLLIQPDRARIQPQSPYRLFSCVLTEVSTCKFEGSE